MSQENLYNIVAQPCHLGQDMAWGRLVSPYQVSSLVCLLVQRLTPWRVSVGVSTSQDYCADKMGKKYNFCYFELFGSRVRYEFNR